MVRRNSAKSDDRVNMASAGMGGPKMGTSFDREIPKLLKGEKERGIDYYTYRSYTKYNAT